MACIYLVRCSLCTSHKSKYPSQKASFILELYLKNSPCYLDFGGTESLVLSYLSIIKILHKLAAIRFLICCHLCLSGVAEIKKSEIKCIGW